MNRKSLAVESSLIGILSQILSLIVRFVVRTYIIRILGNEILGLDSVLTDTIGMLSLAELGITTVMVYRMYAPIVKRDEETLNRLMNTYRRIYYVIALIIAFLGIVVSFLLPYIIKGIKINWLYIYLAYFLQVASSASSYLLAYKRILLNADQKKHFCIIVDTVAIVVFSGIKLVLIILFSSYMGYLICNIAQNFLANIILSSYVARKYPYLKNKKAIEKNDVRLLLKDTKEVLGSKLAGYAYNSTDNIIISIFCGTLAVGLFSNYKYITLALRSLLGGVFLPIHLLIGNYLNSGTSVENSYRTLKGYTFVRFVFGGIATVAFILCADSFVQIWTKDEKYLQPMVITVLLAVEGYIGCIHGVLGEYMQGMGKFKLMKKVMVVGAVSNVLLSIIGALIMGVSGVLLATVISQIIIWIGLGTALFSDYFSGDRKYIREYIRINIGYVLCGFLAILICNRTVQLINWPTYYLEFIGKGGLSVTVFLMIVWLAYRKTDEYKLTRQLVGSVFKTAKTG